MANEAPFPEQGEQPYGDKVRDYIDSGDADAKAAAATNATEKVNLHLAAGDPHPKYLLRNATPVADGTNVDTLTAPGTYVRANSVGSSVALNYPTDTWAGFIEVLANETRSFILQRASFYSTTVGAPYGRDRVWTRTKQGSNPFTAWVPNSGVVTAQGTGSPEGAVTAPVGSKYTDKNATNGAVEWVKTAGLGSTGWKVTYGDTGWRRLPVETTEAAQAPSAHYFDIRRVNGRVYVRIRLVAAGATIGKPRSGYVISSLMTLPTGFASAAYVPVGTMAANTIPGGMLHTMASLNTISLIFQNSLQSGTITGTDQINGSAEFVTDQPWPTTLPGTAV